MVPVSVFKTIGRIGNYALTLDSKTLDSKVLVPDLKKLPIPGNVDSVELGMQYWQESVSRIDDPEIPKFIEYSLEDTRLRALLAAIFGNSPFLSQCLLSDVTFAREIFIKGPEQSLNEIQAALCREIGADLTTQYVMSHLRRARRRVALCVGIADITGYWPLNTITSALSDFADNALQLAVSHLLLEGRAAGEIEIADPNDPVHASGFIVLGMGKLGALELNYSSDIDLILLFDQDVVRYQGNKTPQQFFVLLARKLVRILEERTGEGYVFRTDLRLRPDPGSTPLVLSTMAAETYYESTGQNWERAAMIKARPVAGDLAAGTRFLEYLRPFIWRKNLDFAAIQDIHSIKRQINAVKGGARIAIAGHNVKLGRGGIREIEFYAQTQQLIWGGRDPSLRARNTCETLQNLADAGHIGEDVPDKLSKAYRFLRMTEHRLQMIDDQQTHDLPADPQKLSAFANFMGYADTDSFATALGEQLNLVEDLYAGLFEESPELGGPGTLVFTGGEDHPDTLQTLADLGFREPTTVSATVRAWHHGRYRALRSTRSRELLTELMPALLGALSKTLDPDAALIRFNDFLKGLPSGVQLLSLLYTNPGLLKLLAEIMGSAPRLAETLRLYPILFDAVLTADFFDDTPDADQLIAEFDTALDQAKDFQDVLDILRRQVNDRQFQTGVHILRRHTTPDDAGPALTDIADTALRSLYPRLLTEFAGQHGYMASGDMAIVALGKFGGREMTIGSDLDLLFVYQCSDDASSGPKPLSAVPYFTRLGQRFLGAVTAPTAEGTLFEVDMRLRPSGNAGPLATSFDAFVKYHEDSAWTWEKMALTRARVVVAGDTLKAHLEEAISTALTAPRDPEALLRDVADMRTRMERDRPAAGPWDMKNLRGGLVDIEFIAQYLQLRHAPDRSQDRPAIISANTTEALRRLRAGEFLDTKTADTLIAAMRLWRNVQGVIRLSVGENFDRPVLPEGCQQFMAEVCDSDSFDHLRTRIADTAATCHKIFRRLVEEPAQLLPPLK
jgi:glutamate-ammonia-ligase adenylyltransferase